LCKLIYCHKCITANRDSSLGIRQISCGFGHHSIRGGFTVKLMKLKFKGPSMALGRGLNKYSLSYLILYSFFLRGDPKNSISFWPHKTCTTPAHYAGPLKNRVSGIDVSRNECRPFQNKK